MLSFYKSAKRPRKKATYFRDYDKNKQTRSYQSEWEQGRSWLKDTDNGMVCTICQENGDPSTNMFITGCRSYKLDSVSKHEKSKGHEKSAAIAKAKSENFEKLNKMFRTCHANSSTRMRRPNLKDKINDNTCNFKVPVHIIEDDHVTVQQPSQSEIVQSTTPAANITDTCNINSDREYEIHNLLDRMEDLRQDILNDKLYDSDTDHDGYD